MPKYKKHSESESEESDVTDESDAELQQAFADGKLKPGLNKIIDKPSRAQANNIPEMKRLLTEMKLNLPWIETLDLVNKQAPLAPELAAKMLENEQRRANQIQNNAKLAKVDAAQDPVINDFKREMMFHRQAQSSVMEGLTRLKGMGIVTKRPDDYFAEMAKTDEHMQKVRDALMKRQAEEQRREKVRELRIQRKEGKAIQHQIKLKRQEEKKEMLDQVKKVRKGVSSNLDFLEGNSKGGKKTLGVSAKSKRVMEKRKMKDAKYGFGGKKRGLKRNTKESTNDVSEYRRPGKPKMNNKMGNKGGAAKRLGKNRRQKMKSKGKK